MARFDDCLAVVLKFEGGYTDNPADAGGATNYGVTQAVYNGYRSKNGLPQQPVKFITMAEVSAIYQSGYWAAAHCDAMRIPLDLCMFDTAVNSGVGGATNLLNQAAGIVTGGIITAQTMQVVGNFDPMALATQFMDQREQHYRDIVAANPSQAIFLKGWLSRVDQVRSICGITG